MSRTPHPDPETLAQQLHSTAIHLLRTVRRLDESTGLTAPRLSALSVIVYSGTITLGKLAEAEQVRPPTMTRIVHALEQQQLILKTQDPTDARLIQITATTRGKRTLLRARAQRLQFLTIQIQRLQTPEQQTLSAALTTIQQLVNQVD